MNRLPDHIAKALGVVLYPLFVPTYGIALFCHVVHHQINPLPWIWSLLAILGTFVFTLVLPVTSIWILIRRGEVTDLQIDNPRERTVPYIYSAVSFAFWSYFLISILHAPACLGFVAVGGAVAIGLVAIINRYWKISAHLTGLGGLFGGIFSVCAGLGMLPSWSVVIGMAVLTLILMWARLHVNAHTSAQVCAGWLLGLTCTAIPYMIYSYGT